jgi:hypothetical protein
MALPLLAFAVRRQDDWVAAVLATCWMPFFTDLASYYYAIWLMLGFLVVRRRAVGPGLAILAVVLAALGLIDRAHHARWVFVWSSHAIALFSIWLLVIFSRPRPMGQAA